MQEPIESVMLSLYRVAQGTYRTSPYATTSRQFNINPLLAPRTYDFVLDPMLAPPPGSDPGSLDFQSSAMTTSAKAAGTS